MMGDEVRLMLALGSLNEHKLLGTRRGIVLARASLDVTPAPAESGIPPQPVGLFQTRRGAENRARHALELVPSASFGLGIEGGLIGLAEGMIEDICADVVALICRVTGELHYAVSVGIQFPPGCVRAAQASGQEMTAGDCLMWAAQRYGKVCDGHDPSAFLTRGLLPRSDLLAPAVAAVLLTGGLR